MHSYACKVTGDKPVLNYNEPEVGMNDYIHHKMFDGIT